MNFESPPNILELVTAGKLRALAITSTERSPLLKDVPTTSEAGVKGAEISQWFAVLGPANMPKAVVAKLNSEIEAILRSPEVVERIRSQDGTDPRWQSRGLCRISQGRHGTLGKIEGCQYQAELTTFADPAPPNGGRLECGSA